MYGLTRDLNAQRLAKGQLGLPITIAQQRIQWVLAVCYAMAESGDIEGQREGGDFFVKVQIY